MKKIQYEIWKDIKGYEGIYQVSNYGNVKSLKFNKERILKHYKDKNYFLVRLYKDKKVMTIPIHHLVWDHFGDGKRDGYILVVDHINNDPLDNRIENLQVISNRENTSKDRDKTKTSSKYIGVTWDKRDKKWYSRIQIGGKRIHIGSYDNELDAAKAYKNKLIGV